ncbi:MAG: hypothetical protein JW951_09810 [Lentisphaerae bacterium]|nr:hypothetical protein [Lentisphaerota bacterium]
MSEMGSAQRIKQLTLRYAPLILLLLIILVAGILVGISRGEAGPQKEGLTARALPVE